MRAYAPSCGCGGRIAQINELIAVVGLASMTNRLASAYRVPVDPTFR
jgi:alkylhydroperoxidase family enzyme